MIRSLEIAHIPPSDAGAYPGLYLFTSPARFMRPVRQLGAGGLVAGSIELIGSLEQAYMDIRCPDGGACGSAGLAATHEECSPTAFLSAVASFTPWSDFNQSPRNMYQCQMAKQTMGTPMDSYPFRTDTKLYRLYTPQRPLAQTQGYTKYHVNEYPLGTNAVVAVLAHTGCAKPRGRMCARRALTRGLCSYDMEDAMIINRSSLDRGFAHGSLIKTETVDLSEKRGTSKARHCGGVRASCAEFSHGLRVHSLNSGVAHPVRGRRTATTRRWVVMAFHGSVPDSPRAARSTAWSMKQLASRRSRCTRTRTPRVLSRSPCWATRAGAYWMRAPLVRLLHAWRAGLCKR